MPWLRLWAGHLEGLVPVVVSAVGARGASGLTSGVGEGFPGDKDPAEKTRMSRSSPGRRVGV